MTRPHSDRQALDAAEFAILPWGVTPGELTVLEDVKRCGFNLAGFVRPDELDAVAQVGLKAIVADETIHVSDAAALLDGPEIEQRVKALVMRVKGHPALFGYYLRDEPSARIYPGLARWTQALRAADPQAAPYINLFPNYATPTQLGVQTYEEYVESFLALVAPPFLSYDHYALMEDGTLRDGYWQNLEAVRAAALRHGLPFWNIVLANAHFHYAEPTLAGLRFQAYTTLAYGARGISYFTYFCPKRGNYRLAPIDPFGDRTPTWAMLRDVNRQIHRLGPVYLQLRTVNVFHCPDVPSGCQGIASSRFLGEVDGGSLVVGEFEGPNGSPYAIVVNTDLHHSTHFMVRFKEHGRILQTNAYSGTTEPWGSEDNWLAPGQGVLLGLER